MKNLFQYPDHKTPPRGIIVPSEAESQGTLQQYPTTLIERLLLIAIIVVLPLETFVPTVAGGSITFLIFAGVAGYVFLWRPRVVLATVSHPVLVAGYVFVGVGLFMELMNNGTIHIELVRIAFMVFGAILVAVLCRDRDALKFSMYAYVIAGVWLAVFYSSTSYQAINEIDANNYDEASQLRNATYGDDALGQNENGVSFYMAQGALVALVFSLTESGLIRRFVFLGLGILCLVGAFLPMSRSGILIFVCAGAVTAYARGVMQPKVILTAIGLTVCVMVLVPASVFSRFTINTDMSYDGRFQDSRARVFMAVLDALPEYFLTGVGVGQFEKGWGQRHGFQESGAHNCLAQIFIYWGIPGLLAFLILLWQAYRHIPHEIGKDSLKLCVLGLAVAGLGLSMFMHNIYAKEFSLTLGVLVGSSLWIWPRAAIEWTSTRNIPISPTNRKPFGNFPIRPS